MTDECRSVVDQSNTVISISGIGQPHGYVPDDDESYANGQLVAAAPEMYAVLEAIDSNWRIGGFKGPDDPRAIARFTDRTIETWRSIVTALAKARGEA